MKFFFSLSLKYNNWGRRYLNHKPFGYQYTWISYEIGSCLWILGCFRIIFQLTKWRCVPRPNLFWLKGDALVKICVRHKACARHTFGWGKVRWFGPWHKLTLFLRPNLGIRVLLILAQILFIFLVFLIFFIFYVNYDFQSKLSPNKNVWSCTSRKSMKMFCFYLQFLNVINF